MLKDFERTALWKNVFLYPAALKNTRAQSANDNSPTLTNSLLSDATGSLVPVVYSAHRIEL